MHFKNSNNFRLLYLSFPMYRSFYSLDHDYVFMGLYLPRFATKFTQIMPFEKIFKEKKINRVCNICFLCSVFLICQLGFSHLQIKFSSRPYIYINGRVQVNSSSYYSGNYSPERTFGDNFNNNLHRIQMLQSSKASSFKFRSFRNKPHNS